MTLASAVPHAPAPTTAMCSRPSGSPVVMRKISSLRCKLELIRRAVPSHVRTIYMSWTKQGSPSGPRGYHHGNLKEALIRAALALIAQKGLAGVTFAEAARWAGVSPAAPYRHFSHRDQLLADVARRGFEQFEAALRQAWNSGRPDPFTAFAHFGRA